LTLMFLAFVALTSAQANCEYQLFNVTANDNVTVGDIVEHVSNECSYTVVVKDSFAHEAMNNPLYLFNLKNASVDEVLEVTLTENDLNYTLTNGVLRISYLFTETFYVDYIGTDRSGTSSTQVNLNSNSGQEEDEEGENSSVNSSSSTNIISGDEFIFWNKLQREIETVLNRPEDSYSSLRVVQKEDTDEDGGDDEDAKKEAMLESDIFINKEAGLVTVTGTKTQVERVRDYINKLHERLKRQVMIDVQIMNVQVDNSRSTGIDWSQIYALQNFEVRTFGMSKKNISGFTRENGEYTEIGFQNDGSADASSRTAGLIDVRGQATIDEVVKFLRTQGDVQSVSNPKILTLNNQPALISVGNEYFYKLTSTNTTSGDGATTTSEDEDINSIFAGVLLDVTPEISNDGMITLKINPSLSEELSQTTRNDDGERTMPPDMSRRQISSVISLKDGEHVVLGGLISKDEGMDVKKVPLLGDIPVLGYLFKREEQIERMNELVIIITPRIVSGREAMDLQELGYENLEW
ncbi:MAG: pilus (MSHA type) biogenesis protein MshL, partial [Campylobacterota bacterium]